MKQASTSQIIAGHGSLGTAPRQYKSDPGTVLSDLFQVEVRLESARLAYPIKTAKGYS